MAENGCERESRILVENNPGGLSRNDLKHNRYASTYSFAQASRKKRRTKWLMLRSVLFVTEQENIKMKLVMDVEEKDG